MLWLSARVFLKLHLLRHGQVLALAAQMKGALFAALLFLPRIAVAEQDCLAVSASQASSLAAARGAYHLCISEETKRLETLYRPTGITACLGVPVVYDACEAPSRALCAAMEQRDRKVAECRAMASLERMADLARTREDADAAGIADGMARLLNAARGPANPGGQLSRVMTGLALSALGPVADNALSDFLETANRFDAGGSADGARRTLREMSFVPHSINSDLSANIATMEQQVSPVLDVARTVAEKQYRLPGGDRFTSVDPGQADDLTLSLLGAALQGAPDSGRVPTIPFDLNEARSEKSGTMARRAEPRATPSVPQSQPQSRSDPGTAQPAFHPTGKGCVRCDTLCSFSTQFSAVVRGLSVSECSRKCVSYQKTSRYPGYWCLPAWAVRQYVPSQYWSRIR
ncbi:hypothetical protein ATO6_16920 [Oceanicola sp. 22II-s10i]|nr:hypothetical protein ATO6_16920 [Oceanicola sp. 22II-s10i]